MEQHIADRQTLRVGFRTVQVRDGQILINGDPIFLTGFNRHEDSYQKAMCTDLETARWDLVEMQKAGANFVRLCHYPHHPGELDLCDELGLLVMDEIPLYWWNGNAEGEDKCAEKLASAKRQVEKMIRRDRNHPAVIFWSVSNENQEDRPEVAKGNRELVKHAKGLDASRFAVHVSNHWREHPNFTEDDVICVNSYPSWYERCIKGNTNYDLSASTRFWREGLATLHAQYPHKPILIAEFGSTSLQGVRGGGFGEDTHAEIIEHEFAGMDAPYVCGTTVWCWADHPWPATTYKINNYLAISPYGVLSRDRRKLKPYWTARRLFREKQDMPEPKPATTLTYGASGYEVYMVRPHLHDIPQIAFPEGFGIRPMRLDEGGLWTDIQRDAEPFFPIGDTLFHQAFGDDLQATQWRSYIVTNTKGVGVGVISAWYQRTYKGQDYGQIHWVAIRPSYQGQGLGKAAMSYTLNQMAQWHERAFLGTQTKRLGAIKIYLDFGFVPDLSRPGDREAWQEVKAQLRHPVLEGLEL